MALLPNVEVAMLGDEAPGEKYYGARQRVRKDASARTKVTQPLSYLGGQLTAAVSDYLLKIIGNVY